MNVHENARLTPLRRRELVRRLESGELSCCAGRISCGLEDVRLDDDADHPDVEAQHCALRELHRR